MKAAWALLLASPALGQLSVGLRAGLALTEAFDIRNTRLIEQVRHRGVFGPTVELRLPANLGVTLDLLYNRLEYRAAGERGSRTGGDWEIPVMLRKRFGSGMVRPFVAGGPSFGRLTGLTRDAGQFTKDPTSGITFGTGIEIKIPLLRVTPEFRWTRRISDGFQAADLVTGRNQVRLLVGVTF